LLRCFFLFKFIFLILIIIFYLFLENKNLFSCGENKLHQKGIDNGSEKLLIPTKVDFLKNIEIENIFSGCECTFIKTKSNYFF
jgi:Tfp pilus assembly protein PilZ